MPELSQHSNWSSSTTGGVKYCKHWLQCLDSLTLATCSGPGPGPGKHTNCSGFALRSILANNECLPIDCHRSDKSFAIDLSHWQQWQAIRPRMAAANRCASAAHGGHRHGDAHTLVHHGAQQLQGLSRGQVAPQGPHPVRPKGLGPRTPEAGSSQTAQNECQRYACCDIVCASKETWWTSRTVHPCAEPCHQDRTVTPHQRPPKAVSTASPHPPPHSTSA